LKKGGRGKEERREKGGERGWIGDNPFLFLDLHPDPLSRLNP